MLLAGREGPPPLNPAEMDGLHELLSTIMNGFSTGGSIFIAAIIISEAFPYGVKDVKRPVFGLRSQKKGFHFAVEPSQ